MIRQQFKSYHRDALAHFRTVLAAIMFTAAPLADAYTTHELLEEFDATTLTVDEVRYLQFGLALTGRYVGLMDGKWGVGSQRALEAWAISADLDLPLQNWELVWLASETTDKIKANGWQQHYFEALDVSLAMPQDMETSKEGNSTNYKHRTSSLNYALVFEDFFWVHRLHELVLSDAIPGSSPYTVRRNHIYITSVEPRAGITAYVRSDQRETGWSTVFITASTHDKNLLNAAMGSITKGRSSIISMPPYGRLSKGVATVNAILSDKSKSDEQERSKYGFSASPGSAGPQSSSPASSSVGGESAARTSTKFSRLSTGTGFVVSDRGHMLTNAHVIQDCEAIEVNGQSVTLISKDKYFDLALLKGVSPTNGIVAQFAPRPAPLNVDITVAGYPLSGILSGLNVTRGSVSGLKGLAGDSILMQISAPVQSGNSGGPAVDQAGRVVGVVVSKLDARKVAEVIGDIPQNVNFAVRGEIAKLFLFQNGIEARIAETDTPTLKSEELAMHLEAITRLVECFGSTD